MLMEKEIWHGCLEIAATGSSAWATTVRPTAVQQREEVLAKGSEGKS